MLCIWGFSESISGPYFRANKVVRTISTINIVVSEDFCKLSFQEGIQSSHRFLVFWFKNRLFKRGRGDGSHFLFQFFVVVVIGGC